MAGCIAGTLLTPATEWSVLENFYQVTRPLGFWKPIAGNLPRNLMAKITLENRRDLLATAIAIPWQIVLCLTGIILMMKGWDNFQILSVLLVLSMQLSPVPRSPFPKSQNLFCTTQIGLLYDLRKNIMGRGEWPFAPTFLLWLVNAARSGLTHEERNLDL